MKLNIQDTFNKKLDIDPITENYVRQVSGAFMSLVAPTSVANPSLIHVSDDMLKELGLRQEDTQSDEFLKVFSGNKIYSGTQPFAMCYGGHQFGSWAGQLGDGRAINLFEVNHKGKQWAVQLKGAGKTPYSRTADGLAVLRSSVREYLCSEAMHHLGVPTTRALSLVLSGEKVLRDMLYNGNAAYEKGAIVSRIAPSFIRFGNFQIFAARQDNENLHKLLDYTIEHFYPELGTPSKETYLAFLREVSLRTIQMVVHWERVGFVHGVMNTDNMSILGLTIDYGPYGWVEDYDPNWTPNTTDASQSRYKFGTQGEVAIWNLYQLANALVPIINDIPALEQLLEDVQNEYHQKHQKMILKKLGLSENTPNSSILINDLKKLLYNSEMDMTLFFRTLSSFESNKISEFIEQIAEFTYSENFENYKPIWDTWLTFYADHLALQNNNNRAAEMNATNPKFVLRNYMAQLAIDAAENADYSMIEELYTLLKKPYDNQTAMDKYFAKRPDWAKHKIGCSQLSCSS
jgi:uncharacterized protein YdiU (UPF0061 family)